jgi:NADH:ubiquinone oxidoreductase subunit 2 (subunit N)
MQTHWLDILPLITLAAGGLVIFGAGAFLPRRPSWLLFGLACLTALGAALAAILVSPHSADFLGMVDLGIYSRFFTVLLIDRHPPYPAFFTPLCPGA